MQYTIEARELTNEYRAHQAESLRTVVVARDPDDAIQQYVVRRDAVLVSFAHPGHGQESIATVKEENAVFLVRVYEA